MEVHGLETVNLDGVQVAGAEDTGDTATVTATAGQVMLVGLSEHIQNLLTGL